ncbi:hypothetical protein ACHAWX_001718 [Stephanocyclus meneghinianus]
MEMLYFWLLDEKIPKIFDFQFRPGLENLADYPSKAHPRGNYIKAPVTFHEQLSQVCSEDVINR